MGLYVWITENKTLAGTEYKEYVPDGVEPIYFEDLGLPDIDKLYLDGNEIKRKTEDQLLSEMKQEKIQELKRLVASLLEKTDWIYIKALELGKEAVELYPDIVKKRLEIRAINKQVETLIKNATSIEALQALNLSEFFKEVE